MLQDASDGVRIDAGHDRFSDQVAGPPAQEESKRLRAHSLPGPGDVDLTAPIHAALAAKGPPLQVELNRLRAPFPVSCMGVVYAHSAAAPPKR